MRGGPPDAGGPIVGISTDELEFFNSTADTFGEVDDIDEGLGPRFNLDGCAGCHAQPAVGGTSPDKNPQVAMASKNGARNKVPAFITPTGPVREARFKSDGGVHDLFVITGRTDAPPGCAITQPDFDTGARTGDLIFRIPTPIFGAGLIEAIPDRTIRANQSAYAADKSALGISGRPNTHGNDGTITRFGWKAQNKSLQIFSGEAYNVEQGVTNELFQTEREEDTACATHGLPEDHTHFDAATETDVPSDAVQFSIFMRFLAPPKQDIDLTQAVLIENGRQTFNRVGCESGKSAPDRNDRHHLLVDAQLRNQSCAVVLLADADLQPLLVRRPQREVQSQLVGAALELRETERAHRQAEQLVGVQLQQPLTARIDVHAAQIAVEAHDRVWHLVHQRVDGLHALRQREHAGQAVQKWAKCLVDVSGGLRRRDECGPSSCRSDARFARERVDRQVRELGDRSAAHG